MVWAAGVLLAGQALVLYVSLGRLGADAHAYWAALQRAELYGVRWPAGVDAFNYSPAFAQVVWPLGLLSWPVFCGVWVALEVSAFLWLLRPLGWRWAVPLTLLCAAEWTIGNVVPFIAVAAVLGMRRPGWWSAVVLVKPTMALGPVWFAARGEWRKLGVAVAVTVLVVGVSYAVWPDAWPDWFSLLTSNAVEPADGHNPMVGPVLAVALTVVAARLDARWLLGVAMLVATPVWAGTASLTLLAVVPRLVAGESARRVASGPRGVLMSHFGPWVSMGRPASRRLLRGSGRGRSGRHY